MSKEKTIKITFPIAVKLTMKKYNIENPILISEKIWQDFKMCTTVHQVSDYLELKNNKK